MSETGAVPEIDGRNLARIAEWVDGSRDQNLVVVRKNGEWIVKVEEPGDAAVLRARMPLEVEGRRMGLTVTIGGMSLPAGYDALFWTESAIEKFLFPYYASHRIMTEDEHNKLMEAYQNKRLIAIGHVAPSRGIPLCGDGLETVRVVATKDVQGFDGGITSILVEMSVPEFLALRR